VSRAVEREADIAELTRPNPYAEAHERRRRLDLPFSADRFDGVVFADDL